MLRGQKYRDEVKKLEIKNNAKFAGKGYKLFNASKIGSRLKLRPITYESVRNSSYSLLNTDTQNSARATHKYIHCINKNSNLMKNDNIFRSKALQLKNSVNLPQKKLGLKCQQISGGEVLLSHRLNRASVITKKVETETPEYFTTSKTSKVTEGSIFTFKLPTEKSYNQVHKLFSSIKSLVEESSCRKNKGNRVRTNTADTDATEPHDLNFPKARTLENTEREIKTIQQDDYQTQNQIKEQPLEESWDKNSIEEELKYLKSTVDEGEIGLIPGLLTGKECTLKVAVADVMFIKCL